MLVKDRLGKRIIAGGKMKGVKINEKVINDWSISIGFMWMWK